MRRAPPLLDVARTAQRLAVLLGAGVAPASAWTYLGSEDASGAAMVDAVGRAAISGAAVPEAIDEAARGLPDAVARAWRGLAAAWLVASESGAPLAPTLRDYAGSLRALADADRDVEVALASPRATARVVLALPAVGVLFGALMGFGTLEVLFTTPVGWTCVGVGGGLMLAARSWTRRLVASARPRETAPGLHCDLLAIAVGGGSSIGRASTIADAAAERFGLPGTDARARAAVELSRRAGVPVAELLRAEADEARRDARAHAQRAAAALSVRLLVPLGVCVLPAFLVLGVAPLMIAVLSSTLAGVID
ncbi:type II secretion system F family protein [Schumannella luteola]